MRRRLIAFFTLLLSIGAGTLPAQAQGLGARRFGLYVLVQDVPRAERFYARLFAAPPQVRTPALVGFDVAGGLFALVSRHSFAPGTPAGGSVRPYIRVADIAAAFDHVRRAAPESLEGGEVVVEGPFRFFRVRDPEGNLLEFFAVAGT